MLEAVFGFKVRDPTRRLPLALRHTTIEVGDVDMAREVVERAMANLGDHATIESLAVDGGFTEGKLLWWPQSSLLGYFVSETVLKLVGYGAAIQRQGAQLTPQPVLRYCPIDKISTQCWLTLGGIFSSRG